MILLIFSLQWAKAKLNYFKLPLRRCLRRVDMTVECAEIIRRTAEIRDERVDAISGRPTLVMNDERLMMNDRNSSLVGCGYPVVSLLLRREAGENWREVQKRWRDASFFWRDVKKLRRKAIPLKRSALSFSLAIILFCVCLAHAGQRGVGNPAAAGVALSADSIKPLEIGDSIPEALWNLPLQIVKAGQEGSTTVRLNDYKSKLIILDFWATWCSPCVAAFPKMDSLRKQFGEDLVILPITDQKAELITSFFENRYRVTGERGFSILDKGNLMRTFKHNTLPHYVWINRSGKVQSVTEGKEVNTQNIRNLLLGKAEALDQKNDEPHTYDKSTSLANNVKKYQAESLLSTSSWSRFLSGAIGKQTLQRDTEKNKTRLTLLNTSLRKMYAIAYAGMGSHLFNLQNFLHLQIKDSTAFTSLLTGTAYLQWAKENTYCFEQQVPLADSAYIFQNLQLLLETHFPYKATFQDVEVPSLVLTNPSGASLKSTGGKRSFSLDAYHLTMQNQNWAHLLNRLKLAWQHEQRPLIDETGISGAVDLDIHANLTDVKAVRAALKKYNLELVEEKRTVRKLVITDR